MQRLHPLEGNGVIGAFDHDSGDATELSVASSAQVRGQTSFYVL